MVEKLSSRKLVAFLGGLLYQGVLVALAGWQEIDPAFLDGAQWMGAGLTATAVGAQGLLDLVGRGRAAQPGGGGNG